MEAAINFLSAEFSREESKGSFAEGRVGNLGFWRVWRKDPSQTLTGIDCLALGRRANVGFVLETCN